MIFSEGLLYEETEKQYESYIINCYFNILDIPNGLTDDEEEKVFNVEIGIAV